ncbi:MULTISPECIES: PhzF family phenazine biosynthesis protein [unclassified Streptomyces]|uniref:PhzF family phenazine biosynthesis protein n=1 Tax=unclassified Streptomyces TaxID=2593676 RepID=UPI002E819E4A|nr:PhzF family phenazine biosynthesis protein [Streptomyces sp. NBC_00589]WTI36978.1 PhzF family phenazine biosynthesis protein [Streptomyces sp. NBC_00775]WUB29346.1 PhzF family phenazine biosynthesis protein [Streptomyces sp. NBC_00589]
MSAHELPLAQGLPVAIVDACLRNGGGGSPTAVLDETALSDEQRRLVPVLAGTSHAVFVSPSGAQHSGAAVSLRFFTSEGELPACGHGTVAALAFLAARAGGEEYRTLLNASGRVFEGWSLRDGTRDGTPETPEGTSQGASVNAAFEPGPVDLREPTETECGAVLTALGITRDTLAPGAAVASVGRPRLLVPLTTRSALAALTPDSGALRAACDRLGLLGCYVYSVPEPTGRAAARMFAPSIGVPEDIANANSTACLAAHLAGRGITRIAVDMGDSLGSPATITATAQPGPAGPVIHLGGAARLTRVVRLNHQ